MADIFWDGFDKYLSPGLLFLGEWTALGGVGSSEGVAQVPGRFGGLALQLQSLGNPVFLNRNLPANYSSFVFGVAWQFALGAGGNMGFIFDDGGSGQISIGTDAGGLLKVWRGAFATLLGTSSQPVFQNTWNYLEFAALISPSVGTVSVSLNGLSVLSLTGQNTQATANSFINALTVAAPFNVANEPSITVDDMYLFDTTGPRNNAMRGPSRVETSFPIADTATKAFTVGAAVLGSINSQLQLQQPSSAYIHAPGANILYVRQYTPIAGGTVSNIVLQAGATSVTAKFKGVMYADNAGVPGALLTSGTEVVGCTNGSIVTLPLVTPQAIVANTPYWLGLITDTSVSMFVSDTNNVGSQAANTYASGAPNPAPAMTTGQTSLILYGNVGNVATNWSEIQSAASGLAINPVTSTVIDNPSYVTSNASGAEDLYTFASLTSNPVSIAGMKLVALMEILAAGSRSVDLRTKSGATESPGSASGFAPSQSYNYAITYFDTDPNTGSPWLAANLNTAISGFRITA